MNLKDRSIDIVQFEEQKGKNEHGFRDLWDTIKHNSIHTMGISGGEKKASERIFEEIMIKNSPNLMKNINLPIHEAPETPTRINSGGNTHNIIKLLKKKTKNPESSQREVFNSS